MRGTSVESVTQSHSRASVLFWLLGVEQGCRNKKPSAGWSTGQRCEILSQGPLEAQGQQSGGEKKLPVLQPAEQRPLSPLLRLWP